MGTQKCEICGEWKDTHEMSKSYKHRCKACVAEATRKSREHMPMPSAKHCADKELLRMDIATKAMQSIVSNDNIVERIHVAGIKSCCEDVTRSIAMFAVSIADNMLAEMKGENYG
ncbi:MAG: hypothetical protein NC344_05705 [Bacteroidales bacterium]|nr:hypothetical protein [Bacteroidales bacterium]MCM1147315.1 hypothetical protein [Bacteroidales bacterium]MCM1206251.1 hypothetical protein [Bacillota bacterium]